MFRTVQAKLVLVGRSGLPPKEQWEEVLARAGTDAGLKDKIEKVRALEAAGAEVLVLAADVSRVEQMEDVVRQAVARFGTIHGVFHAAGVPGQGLTQLKSAETAAGVLAPKIQGTLALDAALKDIHLDFLLLVSSIASFTGGGPGQIDYCAGNAFLDAYARRHVRRHGITVAINFGEWQWDAWSAGLLGFPPEVREAFIANRRKFGIGFQEGMEAIRRILHADVAQVIVVPENFHPMVGGSNECTAAKLTEEVNRTRKQQRKSYPRPALGTSFVPVGTSWSEDRRDLAADPGDREHRGPGQLFRVGRQFAGGVAGHCRDEKGAGGRDCAGRALRSPDGERVRPGTSTLRPTWRPPRRPTR